MDKKNLFHGLIGFLAVIIGFIAKGFYRPYILANRIDDLGFAACSPSFFYVIGFSQLLLIKKTKYPWLIISIVTLGSVAYEVWQSFSINFFDIKDTLASLMGGIISIILMMRIDKKNNFKRY